MTQEEKDKCMLSLKMAKYAKTMTVEQIANLWNEGHMADDIEYISFYAHKKLVEFKLEAQKRKIGELIITLEGNPAHPIKVKDIEGFNGVGEK